jgi:hypothetical protein
MNDQTHSFFRIKSRTFYLQACQILDESRGFPNEKTDRSFPSYDDLPPDPQDPETRYLQTDKWRITENDQDLIAQGIDLNAVELIDCQTYLEAILTDWQNDLANA